MLKTRPIPDDDVTPHDAHRASGNWNPTWEPFARLDPAWTEKAIAVAIAPTVSGALNSKTVELVAIALDAAYAHPHLPSLRRHIRRALQAGATREEITAVLQLASLQGLNSLRLAAPILIEELNTRAADLTVRPDTAPTQSLTEDTP